MNQKVHSLALKFCLPYRQVEKGVEEQLLKLHNSSEESILKSIAAIANPNTKREESLKIKADLEKKLAKRELIKYFIQKLSMSLLGKDNVPHIFAALKESIEDQDVTAIKLPVQLLLSLSSTWPELFSESLKDLFYLLSSDDQFLIEKV